MATARLIIRKGREKALIRHHAWIFSGAVKEVTGAPADGATVEVVDEKGKFLAYAAYSSRSQISGRVWSFDDRDEVGFDFFVGRMEKARNYREALGLLRPDGGCRLIASEADGLPGVVADYYGGFIVVQFVSSGAEYFRAELLRALQEVFDCKGIYERSDLDVRKKEGLEERHGHLVGKEVPQLLEITENNYKLLVDIRHGHKSGFYLDQKVNRAYAGKISAGRKVLNCFSYTGAFGVAAALGGALKVVNVDSSAPALEMARRNMELNSVAPSLYENVEGDVFTMLRAYRDAGERFGLIILDPPKFIKGKGDLMRGARAYKDIALLAFSLLDANGILLTFSCSGLMEMPLFQKITFDAALDAGKEAVLTDVLLQSPDHPILLSQPESLYLKGIAARVK